MRTLLVTYFLVIQFLLLFVAFIMLTVSCGTEDIVDDYKEQKQSKEKQSLEEEVQSELDKPSPTSESEEPSTETANPAEIVVEVHTEVRVDMNRDVDPTPMPLKLIKGLTMDQVEEILDSPDDSWLTAGGFMWKYGEDTVCVKERKHCAVYFNLNKRVVTWVNIDQKYRDPKNP